MLWHSLVICAQCALHTNPLQMAHSFISYQLNACSQSYLNEIQSDYLIAGWNWVHNTDVLYFHTHTRFTQKWPLIFRNDESNVHSTKFYWKSELKCRHWHNTAWIKVKKKIQIISYQQHNDMTKSYALWCDPHYHILWAEPFLSIPLFISKWIDV